MEVKLQKWGNSSGIRIPSIFIKNLNLSINDTLLLEEQEDKIIITKAKKKISLKERFDNYKGKDLTKEFVWDEARGREIW